jgi:outer membrane autotransporter protein
MKSHMRRALLATTASILLASAAHAQSSDFNQFYSFGDSLSDNGRVVRETGSPWTENFENGRNIYEGGRWSNAPVWVEVLPGLIDTPYVATNHFAVGGARSTRQAPNALVSFPWGVPDQIDTFQARVGSLQPNDLASVWIGYNDISAIPVATNANPALRTTAVTPIVNNTANAVQQLYNLGGREFIVLNQNTFRPGGRVESAQLYNALIPDALLPISQAGANVRLFDVDSLLQRMRANPTQFGFIPAASTTFCSQDPACAAAGTLNGGALENQYIFVEGVHLTGRTNTWIAQFLANQINAPRAIAAQAQLAAFAGRTFSNSLLDRLDAMRWGTPTVMAAYSADLPGRQIAPAPVPALVGSPFSVFAYGTYATGDQRAGVGQDRSDYDLAAATVGLEYRFSPFFVVGGAFNYVSGHSDLRGRAGGDVDVESYQGAVFASFTTPNVFVDGAVTFGWNDYDLSRPGIFDNLTASTDGNTVTAAVRAGYLFDLGSTQLGPLSFSNIKLGPIAGLTYSYQEIGSYTERGDPLLTIGVRSQELDGLTGNIGAQLRYTYALGNLPVSSFLNVTAEHDFDDGVRTIQTFQTYAPALVIRTRAGRGGDETYGRIGGGVSVNFTPAVSAQLTTSSTFARRGSEEYAISGGLTVKF